MSFLGKEGYIPLTDTDYDKNLTSIIEDIEKFFQKRVYLKEFDDPNSHSACIVNDAGVPMILLKRSTNTEYNVSHELLHLHLKTKGYFDTRNKKNIPSDVSKFLSDYLSNLSSVIEHLIIYPTLIELGYNPYNDLKKTVQNLYLDRIKDSRLLKEIKKHKNLDAPFISVLVMYYVRVFLELKDEQTFSQFRNLMLKNQKRLFLKAQKISNKIRVFKSANELTPENTKALHKTICREMNIPLTHFEYIRQSQITYHSE